MVTTTDTERFLPYVPRLVREWLDSPDPEATHRVMEGSTIFADISGFTKLSERLARIGQEGAEEVTEVIGQSFSLLLEPAYSYDGTLVKFGGDALLLFYRGDDHELRAASAALEMRRAIRSMGSLETPVGKVTLRMSQGVHSGAYDVFLVGSSMRELIMAGSATTRLGQLEGAANAGQIIVSEATARALPAKNVGDPEGGWLFPPRQCAPAGAVDDQPPRCRPRSRPLRAHRGPGGHRHRRHRLRAPSDHHRLRPLHRSRCAAG